MPLVPTPSPWPTHHPVRALRKSFPLCRYIYIEKNANMSSQSKFCDKNQPDQQLGIYYAAVVPSEVPDLPAFIANMKSATIFYLKGLKVLPTTTSLDAVKDSERTPPVTKPSHHSLSLPKSLSPNLFASIWCPTLALLADKLYPWICI